MKTKTVLIGVISNRASWPVYFCRSLFELYNYTNQIGINAHMRTFSSTEVQQMRNHCCLFAIENKFDYVFMLDDDMTYPIDSIERLIKHNKDFVVGSATQRVPPFLPTQYKNAEAKNFKNESNRIFVKKGDKKLVKIGSTGVVGALIKTSVFKKLKSPFFKITYKKNGVNIIGSDTYFCIRMNEKNIKMYLDPAINYKHEVVSFSDSFGVSA